VFFLAVLDAFIQRFFDRAWGIWFGDSHYTVTVTNLRISFDNLTRFRSL